MKSIVLIGDGTLDNELYSEGAPSIAEHLGELLPLEWQVSSLAQEGSSLAATAEQIDSIPMHASHLVVSMGGVDALANVDLFTLPIKSAGEGLDIMGERLDRFEAAYRKTLGELVALRLPVTLCTIYNGRLGVTEAGRARIALSAFNDRIVQIAVEHRLPLIEMRQVCNEPTDFATPIAASGEGGKKIATAIAHALGLVEAEHPPSTITAG